MSTVAFIVNGGIHSAMGQRARSLAINLQDRYDVRIAYRSHRKVISILRFLVFLFQVRPRVSYVFDMSYSGVLAAGLYKFIFRNYLIIDTGDAVYELMRSFGGLGVWGLTLIRFLQTFSFRAANRIVVRGTFHQRLLLERGLQAAVIRDGVETDMFTPFRVDELRKQHNLDRDLTVGVMGSVVWSEKCQMCFGWELVEVIRLLKNAPVKGIIIGDGSGLPRLKARCREYGIEDKVLFFGHMAYDQLPRYLNLIDVCLSSQPNEIAYQVRTTGKLPLYMACGRHILASRVGEASLVLGEEMLLDYEGLKDPHYPEKVAEKIKALLNQPEKLDHSRRNVAVAKAEFDYSILANKVASLLQDSIGNEYLKRLPRSVIPSEH